MSKNSSKSANNGTKSKEISAVKRRIGLLQDEFNRLTQLQNKPYLSIDELKVLASQEYLLGDSEYFVLETNSPVYPEMMDNADEYIEKLCDVLNIPLFKRGEFRQRVKDCAAELLENSKLKTEEKLNRKIPDQALLKTIEWPQEKFLTAPEKGKHGGLIAFLRRVWKPVIDGHNIIMPLSVLAKNDAEAAQSIYVLRRTKPLPSDLYIMTEAEITEKRIAADPEGLAKQLIAGRRTRARMPAM